MKNLLKSLLVIILSADPILWLYLRLRNKTPRIILYHGISDDPIEAKTSQAMACEKFNKHLKYLKKHYTNVALEEVVAARDQRQTLPRNAITLTFDDGYRNNHDLAVPFLLQHGFTATFFINPQNADLAEQGKKAIMWWDIIDLVMDRKNYLEFAAIFEKHGERISKRGNFQDAKVEMEEALKEMRIENNEKIIKEIKDKYVNKNLVDRFPEFMDWRQLRAIKNEGMSIGAHTMSHATASKLPESRFNDEFVKAKEILEEKMGEKVDWFAFPYGGGKHYSKASIEALKQAGYRCALLVLSGRDEQEGDLFCLNRTSIHKMDDFRLFKIKVSGIYDDIKQLFAKYSSFSKGGKKNPC